jgi:hypothetical protein
LCVKGILARDLGFVGGPFHRGFGGFRGGGGEGAISTTCRGPAGVFEAHPDTPIPPSRLCLPQIQAIDYCHISSISKRPKKFTIFDPFNLERCLLSLGNLQSLRLAGLRLVMGQWAFCVVAVSRTVPFLFSAAAIPLVMVEVSSSLWTTTSS